MAAGSKIYNAVANFGRTTATVKAYVGYVLAAALALSGLYCLVFGFGKPDPPNTPKDQKKMNPRLLGLIVLGVAALAAALSWLEQYLAQKSKLYAAASGAGTGIDIAQGLISRVWGD
jgi:peptidoglycan biosynthesis protein MviN/MurJ (putative lipid II flippase)